MCPLKTTKCCLQFLSISIVGILLFGTRQIFLSMWPMDAKRLDTPVLGSQFHHWVTLCILKQEIKHLFLWKHFWFVLHSSNLRIIRWPRSSGRVNSRTGPLASPKWKCLDSTPKHHLSEKIGRSNFKTIYIKINSNPLMINGGVFLILDFGPSWPSRCRMRRQILLADDSAPVFSHCPWEIGK